MTPEQAAQAAAGAISEIAEQPMVHHTTYERGAELGFEGIDFYLYGRGAALGAVHPDTAASTYVFFSPELVRAAWEAGRALMPPTAAALEWAACLHRWACNQVPDDVDAERLAALAAAVVRAADASGLPLFAAWRQLPEPRDFRALAVHHLNALRELRGGLHAMAVRAVGLTPAEAMAVRDAWLLAIHGWPEPGTGDTGLRDRWVRAEDLTNAMIAPAFGALDAHARGELVDLAGQLHRAVATTAP